MYKILIVDDESAIRKGLVNFINWDELECIIVGEAVNGLDAIDKIREKLPDIVITDIKMPGLNGIELSKYIYENYPSMKVIILTGFAEFSFAQSAIAYGVLDFVLKPTTKEKVISAVNKAIKSVESDRKKETDIRNLQNLVNGNMFEMQERFFLDIISRILVEPEKIISKLQELGIQVSNFYIIMFEVDNSYMLDNDVFDEEHASFLPTLRNVLTLVYKDQSHYIFAPNHKLICVLLNFSLNDTSECMQTILNSCDEVLQTVNTFMDFSICASISIRHGNILEFYSAYEEALKALSYKFYNDSMISIFSTEYSIERTYNLFTDTFMDNVLKAIQSGNVEQAYSDVMDFFERQKREKLSIEHLKNISIQLCSLCSQLLSDHNASLTAVVEDGENLYKKILQSKTINNLIEIISSVIKSTALFVNKPDKRVNFIIQKSLEFINQNYNKNITLRHIADFAHVNSSYLSRLFRKETGETLTDTITKVRLEEAKKLLVSSDIKTYEIAYMVGIEDPTYFSQIFKKYTGLSPKEFKYSKFR